MVSLKSRQAAAIRIEDLRDPVLTADQRQLLEEAERNPVDLNEEAVLAAAAERTRLDDFGPQDFRVRLRLILEELDADSNATALCRATVFNRAVGATANRSLAVDLLRRHPEIHEIEIERPIVIAGLPRSGTTHLLGLLGADPRLHSLPFWESTQPIPLPGEATPRPDRADPRYLRCEQGWQRLQRVNPTMAAYHPMDPDHIHEDIELQMPDFSTYMWEWAFRAPRWRDFYLSHDQTPHYEYARTMLKVLEWQRGKRKRWVLKAPQHLEQLGPLLKVYPDATVVLTHRDPVASLQSIVTQLSYISRTRDREVVPDYYLEYWTDRVRRLLEAYVRDIDLVPLGQRIDVPFDEFLRDELGMVERIYATAGLPLTDEARTQHRRYRDSHPRGRHGRIVHDLPGDFGVEPEQLQERFAFYLDRVLPAAEAR